MNIRWECNCDFYLTSNFREAVISPVYFKDFFQIFDFQNKSIERILKDAKEDRELFKEAINKIDQRMYLLEEQMKDIKSEMRNKQ